MTTAINDKVKLYSLRNEWGNLYAWCTRIRTRDPALQRRGELLVMFILLIGGILAYTLLDNLIYLMIQPSLEYTLYLLEEIFVAALLYGFLVLNRRGQVELAAYVTISFAIIFAAFASRPPYLEYLMVVFALPIAISSFIIRPSSSFLFAFLTAFGYVASSIVWGYSTEYNLVAIISLFALAFMTWVIASQLEDTLQKNNALNTDLQHSNAELKNAYETTLEGWSRALDLRDHETEGHTRRVAELTVHMARVMGLSAEELVNIRRGALLHDIGKMGVPDKILHKPGKLTEAEWAVMRQHTLFAYEMIHPIEYLRPVLDIPCYHHEKWDGTGYPYGLKGTQIPLAARIFTLADVYDALSSNRPYREAWPKERAIEYIRQNSGTHFDPSIVGVFIREIKTYEAP